MKQPPTSYGLLIERRHQYGNEYVTARLVRRDPGKDHPLGVQSYEYENPYQMDGLGLYGFVSVHFSRPASEAPRFIGAERPEYKEVYSVNASTARKMVKTFAKIEAQAKKDAPTTPAETLHSLARALKLSFVVQMHDERPGTGCSYEDRDWRFMDIADGKRAYAFLITQAEKAEANRVGYAAAA